MNKIYISIICSFFIGINVFAASDEANTSAATSERMQETQASDINNRLSIIEDKSSALQKELIQLDERISFIEQKMGQLGEHNAANKENFFEKVVIVLKPIKQYIDKIAASLGIDPRIIILAISAVVLSLIYLLFRRRSTSGHAESTSAKDEYNIMENQEGVSAKLNLARAYIAMGKNTEAQTLLQEVLANGKPTEQNDARELLKKIPH